MREGGVFFRACQFVDARNRFESARQAALASRQNNLAAQATSNIGGCEFSLHAYQPALHSYLEARRLAESAGDTSAVAVLDANIASLYAQMGELDAAFQWLQGSLQRVTGPNRPLFLPQMQIEMGSLLARQERASEGALPAGRQRMRQAMPLFRQGIDGADRAGNRALYAIGWNRLGEELLDQNDLPDAERALLEAFRVRKLNRLPLDASYCNLGKLRLAQGDLTSASALLDRAVELAEEPQGPMPNWHVYDARGRARLAQGRLREALDDLRIAVRLARAFRWSAPAADATRIGAEGILDHVHSELIEAGNRLYIETRDPALIRETFEAAEENRANSLRQLVNGRRTQTALPASYWEAIARLQRAEIAALRSSDAGTQQAVHAARAELVLMEASLVPDSQPLSGRLMDRVQAALTSDTALLSFHLGHSISWLWALDRDSLVLYALPPQQEIQAQVQTATEAIRENASNSALAGARLYRTLFGLLAPRFQRKTEWLLALDAALLEVPVAALPVDTMPRLTYLVERHNTQLIPGAGYWVESAAQRDAHSTSPVFVGIGDPIYNGADPRAVTRLPNAKAPPPTGLRLLAASGPRDGAPLALPRLVGSSSELDRCAHAWQGEHILLKGADASCRNLTEQLRRNPAVVHFATHFVESSERPSYGLIALSLTDRNEAEFLQPREIANWRVHVDLVVLSGCHSGAGATLPGTGMLGLTRAWLTAGAQSVLASRWATPDEEGDLFNAFYQTLSGQRRADPTQALRAAQLEMIRSGGWRARPRYWGTYFVVGN
ncbi:MAG: CHAT domain-containing protein [Acidobacteriia bacterium]|nr:CHAT domain-containing protein [Terriglobia bacterium]